MMKPKNKQNRIQFLIILLLAITGAITIASCGSEETSKCAAPSDATIVFAPLEWKWTIGNSPLGANLPLDWQVSVLYKDGTPMPNACINIAGALAVPNGFAAYQFMSTPTWVAPNPVNSGFRVTTDDFGKYQFSVLISAGTSSFKESIMATSGNVMGLATLELD
jgi:hypothetical protein